MKQRVSLKNLCGILNIPSFKKEQKDILKAVLDDRDVIGVLPTGFGKSICYIAPHLIKEKTVIVISPLISLMKDQQRRYSTVCRTFASFGNRDIHDSDGVLLSQDDKKSIYSGETSCVLYMTPESFIYRSDWIRGMEKHICLIAIDECHCITSWSDFRTSYTQLNTIKALFKKSPSIMAVTGTATKSTVTKIISELKLNNPLCIHISPNRDDLYLSVMKRKSFEKAMQIIREFINGKTIIYCKTKKDTEKIANYLRMWGYLTGYYHAGLSSEERTKIQDQFTSGRINVIGATIAFGMGVDIPDIETIIHYGVPRDIESYCQEIGRAARSPGLDGNCLVLWSSGDFVVNKHFLKLMTDPYLRAQQEAKMRVMSSYINNTRLCRTEFINNYFLGDSQENRVSCGKCDICMNKSNPSCFFSVD